MIIISRSAATSISIGDEVTVTVVSFNPYKNEVQLGVDAPTHLSIYPTELNKTDTSIWGEAANEV